MNLNKYLEMTKGKYDQILELIKHSRDIASGQTKYKNYLIDLKIFLNSNNIFSIGQYSISSIEELNDFFKGEFVDWQGLENEISNAVRFPINYENVECLKSTIGLEEFKTNADYKGINYANYESYGKSFKVSWNGDDGHLLGILPKAGNNYEIISKNRFDKEELYCFVYENPTTENNGIQNLNDIEELRLCLCQIDSVHTFDNSCSIEANVRKIFSLNDIITLPKLNYQDQDFWYKFLMGEHANIEKFGDFFHASINIQSDIGANYIFKIQNESLHLLMIEEWGITQSTFQYIVNYEIIDTKLKNKITNIQ